MNPFRTLSNLKQSVPLVLEAAEARNLRVLRNLAAPSYRGLVQQRGKHEPETTLQVGLEAVFNWTYQRDHAELAKLYELAKKNQWNGSELLDWSIDVDPHDNDHPLLPYNLMPTTALPEWDALPQRDKEQQRHAITAWFLSQFLHGEQGALFAAAQVTNAVPWVDAKLFGATQVMDEGRHFEVFYRYLHEKLEKIYPINDNLYVILDSLMSDSRWDFKFLGMQIMVEGLALGAFRLIFDLTEEPLLKNLLEYVIRDEARHVRYGVLALSNYYNNELTEYERIEREDWAFEVSLLMRNRFLAHEFYDEYYAHKLSRDEWDRFVYRSEMMRHFHKVMFARIIPNLKAIGLLTDRIRPRYEKIDLLKYEVGKATTLLSDNEVLTD